MDAFADPEDVAAVSGVPEGGRVSQMCLIREKHGEGDVGGFGGVLEECFGFKDFSVAGSLLVVCVGGFSGFVELGKILVEGRISRLLQDCSGLDESGSFGFYLGRGFRGDGSIGILRYGDGAGGNVGLDV